MKTIYVASAVLCDSLQSKHRIFATAKGYGKFKGQWEFPGGKLEEGETAEEALRREIREELDVEITIGEKIETVQYDYPDFHLSMDCFWCQLKEGQIKLREAQEGRWLAKEELFTLPWLPADINLLRQIERQMSA